MCFKRPKTYPTVLQYASLVLIKAVIYLFLFFYLFVYAVHLRIWKVTTNLNETYAQQIHPKKLLTGCHQPTYRLHLDETYAPFLLPIFSL